MVKPNWKIQTPRSREQSSEGKDETKKEKNKEKKKLSNFRRCEAEKEKTNFESRERETVCEREAEGGVENRVR